MNLGNKFFVVCVLGVYVAATSCDVVKRVLMLLIVLLLQAVLLLGCSKISSVMK